MKKNTKKIIIGLSVFLLLVIPLGTLAAAADGDAQDIPVTIRNNAYYQESIRLARLAQDNFDFGDYDASTNYAEEATRYALLSDEYIALQLRIKGAGDAFVIAHNRLVWASEHDVQEQYPARYAQAQAAYDEAAAYMDNENWDEARNAANRSIQALAGVVPETGSTRSSLSSLPAQYTVRTWESFRDCLWNIAGMPWAYGDPSKWTILYSANRSQMPEPENPDLIHPGMILEIPSIQGEERSGMWNAGTP